MKSAAERSSKLLSLVLRHAPERVGVSLDGAGFVAIDELLTALARHGTPLTRAELDEIVATNAKRRFVIRDGTHIRAAQGHSIAVDLGLAPITPPDELFHGTVARFVSSIAARGLVPGERQHVHLSATREAAIEVGRRRGQPIVVVIAAAPMHAAGHAFFRSENGVFLIAAVPPLFLSFPPR